MSKEFPDPCPKVRGDHAFLKKFYGWYKKCQETEGILRIIPFPVKKNSGDRTPEKRWPKKIRVTKPVRNVDEPVVEVQLIHGPLSQRVQIAARDLTTLQQLQLC